MRFLLLLIASISMHAADGYGKTTWGMSLPAVLAADSDIIKSEEAAEGSDKFQTHCLAMSKKPIAIGSDDELCSISYLFDRKTKALAQVNVSLIDSDDQIKSTVKADSWYNEMHEALTSKYGAQAFSSKPEDGEGNYSVKWYNGKTEIELLKLHMGDISTALIIYRPRLSSTVGSDKL
jgi:hypothetical protein